MKKHSILSILNRRFLIYHLDFFFQEPLFGDSAEPLGEGRGPGSASPNLSGKVQAYRESQIQHGVRGGGLNELWSAEVVPNSQSHTTSLNSQT